MTAELAGTVTAGGTLAPDGSGDAGIELPVRDYFPIRVVSQRTGVNTVTLRAWERRYGLLRPVRTAKGHRLYSADDIDRILRVVDWLQRGVSISRVRGLLDRHSDSGADVDVAAADDGDWAAYRSQIQRALSAFDDLRLDEVINQALALYPFVTVCERLLNPLGHAGVAPVPAPLGATVERLFVDSYLRRKLATRILLGARQVQMAQPQQAPVLIALLPPSGGGHDGDAVPAEPATALALLMLAAGFIELEFPVLLLDMALPVDELLVAAERRKPVALVLYGASAREPAAFGRLLRRLHEGTGLAPVLAGPVARIHEAAIGAAGGLAVLEESPAQVARRLVLQLDQGVSS